MCVFCLCAAPYTDESYKQQSLTQRDTYTHSHTHPSCFGFVCMCVCFWVYVLLCLCHALGLLRRCLYMSMHVLLCTAYTAQDDASSAPRVRNHANLWIQQKNITSRINLIGARVEGRDGTKKDQNKIQSKLFRLVQATPWSDFAVFSDQL